MPTSTTCIPDSTTNSSSYVYRDRSWTNTANYRNVLRDDRPVNSYADDRRYMTQGVYSGATGTNNSTGVVTVYANSGFVYSGTDLLSKYNAYFNASSFATKAGIAYNGMLVQLLGKVADQKANLGVAYAEAAKTAAHISHTAERLDRAYRALRSRNFWEVAKQLNINFSTSPGPRRYARSPWKAPDVHKTWLEYKYGWMPLLMDVKGTAELFAQHVVGRPLRFSVQAKVDVPFVTDSSTSYAAFGGGTASWSETLSGSYSARSKLWLEITNPHLAALQQMGLTNPLLVAWELVPYSFVLDWFISVGDWLKGLSALHGVSIRRAMRSNINSLTYTYSQPATTAVSSGSTFRNGAKVAMVRQRAYNRGIPSVNSFDLYPPINDNLGFTKLVTSLALLRAAHR